MAKRKGWQRALGGLGEGIGNASQYLLRQQMQDRQDEKIFNRQMAINDATTKRQTEIDNQNFKEELLKAVAKGEQTPAQATAIARGRGITLDGASLSAVKPTMRRQLESGVGKFIGDASSPEQLGDGDIMGQIMALDGAMPADDEPGMRVGGLVPEAYEYVVRAQDKAETLRKKPTDQVTRMTPGGGEETLFTDRYSGPVETKPSATQQGVFKGITEAAATGEAGQSRAEQAGREAAATTQSRLNTENAPANVAASARREGSIAGARSSATFPNDLRIAQERAKLEVQTAVDKTTAVNLAEASKAAVQLEPFLTKLTTLSGRINTRDGIVGRGVGVFRAGQAMVGDDPDVVEMGQLIAQNLRPLAVVMGVTEANVSNSETSQALEGIGIKAWTTKTEAANALRNLQDAIHVGPIVAARLGTGARIGERMQLAQQLIDSRRGAERDAAAAGFDSYLDPVTMTPRRVIK